MALKIHFLVLTLIFTLMLAKSHVANPTVRANASNLPKTDELTNENDNADDEEIPKVIKKGKNHNHNLHHRDKTLYDLYVSEANSLKPKIIYQSSILQHCEPEKKLSYYINNFVVIEEDYDCADRYILIHYEYYDHNSKYHEKKGYLLPYQQLASTNGICVQPQQKQSSNCPLVKKF